jgi:hypothetical protein
MPNWSQARTIGDNRMDKSMLRIDWNEANDLAIIGNKQGLRRLRNLAISIIDRLLQSDPINPRLKLAIERYHDEPEFDVIVILDEKTVGDNRMNNDKKKEMWDKAIYTNGFRDGMSTAMDKKVLSAINDALESGIAASQEEFIDQVITPLVKGLISKWNLSTDLLTAASHQISEYLMELVKNK